jgi:hypothetical protein
MYEYEQEFDMPEEAYAYDDRPTEEEIFGTKPSVALDHSSFSREDNVKEAKDKNKNRVSALPWNYDPTPPPSSDEPGYVRPAPKVWIESFDIEELDMCNLVPLLKNDEQVVKKMKVVERKYRFLASKCVCEGKSGRSFIKDKGASRWNELSNHAAKAQLKHDWGGDQTLFNITDKTVDEFFRGNKYPVVQGTIYAPNMGDFVRYRGEVRLNTWAVPQLAYAQGSIADEHTELMLRIIVENLLNEKWNGIEALRTEISSDKDSVLRWVFHYLASLYQRPGKSLPVVLWIVGLAQGIGKTMFGRMMLTLIGEENGIFLNNEELTGGWNDFIGNNQLMLGDEVKFDSKKEFYDMLKRYISTEQIALRKRNVGTYLIPNVTNWIFFTNNPKPVTIDDYDRRNTFIATTKDMVNGKPLARQFYMLSREKKKAAYQGIAEFFGSIEIDDALISTAIWTPLKEEIAGTSRSPVLRWLLDERRWQPGKRDHSEKLYGMYSEWCQVNNELYNRSQQKFFELMFEAQERGFVCNLKNPFFKDGKRRRGYEFIKRPITRAAQGYETTLEEDMAEESGKHSNQNVTSLMDKLRERMKSKPQQKVPLTTKAVVDVLETNKAPLERETFEFEHNE